MELSRSRGELSNHPRPRSPLHHHPEESGAFRLGPLPRGRYRVEVQSRSCPALLVGEHDVEPGEERDLGVHYLKPPLR